MKNLKKILALVLVMAVVFSFAAVSTSAAFTDAAEIARKEAVDVMAAIGVINGYTDGTFKPKGEVTRAEMAKMITVLLNKGDDVGELYKGAVTFADSASHWAAGYIAYCAQEKIINGRNASTFDPNANVTGTEAAKMLLCALGYDPAVEGLTGASWASNTLSLAKKCEIKAKTAGAANANTKFSLLNDMDDVSMTTPLSRENAAQMMLNAMDCTQVDYSGSANTITIGNTSFTTGANLIAADNNTLYDVYSGTDMTPAKRLGRDTENDAFGRPSIVWTRGNEDVGSYSDAPVVSYKDAVTGGQVYTDLGKPAFTGDNAYTLVAKVDGADRNDLATVKGNIVSGDPDTVTPVGSWTEVYVDDENMTITMVTAKYYLAKIASIVAGKVDANGDATSNAYVTLKKADTDAAVGSANKILVDGVEKWIDNAFVTDAYTTADRNVTYVVYTKGQKAENGKTYTTIESLAKAEVKSGVAGASTLAVAADGTATKLSAFTLDSTSYNVVDGIARFSDFGTNATIYLDPNGNVLFGEGTSSDTFAYVVRATIADDSLYAEDKTTHADLLFTDGTFKSVTVYDNNDKGYRMVKDNAGKEKLHAIKYKTDGSEDGTVQIAQTIVTYYVNANGEYVLTAVDTDVNDIVKVQTNMPSMPTALNADGSAKTYSGKYANDNTVFIVENSVDNNGVITYTYTTYTGLKNIPTVVKADDDRSCIAAVANASNPTAATYVFVVGGEVEGASSASVSVFMKNSATDGAAFDANNTMYYTTKAVVDGEIKTVKMNSTTYANTNVMIADTLTVFNQMVVDENGYVTSLNANNMDYVLTFDGFMKKDGYYEGLYNNGIISLSKANAADEAFAVNASVPVYVFDTTADTITQTTIDAFSTTQDFNEVKLVLDSAEYKVNGAKVITAIYASVKDAT